MLGGGLDASHVRADEQPKPSQRPLIGDCSNGSSARTVRCVFERPQEHLCKHLRTALPCKRRRPALPGAEKDEKAEKVARGLLHR